MQYSAIREIFDRAPKNAINMGIGEPDFGPPQVMKDAFLEAVEKGLYKYGPTKGMPELRRGIAEMLSRTYPGISEGNIMVTCGATQGVMTSYETLFDPAVEVLIPDPGFVLYSPDALLVDAEPVPYYLWKEDGFEPNIEEMKNLITPRTEGIVVNSPSNPTGAVISKDKIRAIAEIASDNGLWVISDEVYDHFLYQHEHGSFLPYLENSIVVNSFSKSLGIPGWRIGYIVANQKIIEHLAKINYYSVACPSTPIQYAVTKALPELEHHIAHHLQEYDERRKLIVKLLNEIPGFKCSMPEGAFYVFPSYDQDISCMDLAFRILQAGVVCIPGCAFGDAGDGHLRFSYATNRENIEKGVEQVKQAVASIPRLDKKECGTRKGRPC